MLTDKEIDEYLDGVRSGKYDPSSNLPLNVYDATAKHIMNGLVDGVGGIKFGEKEPELMRQFQENVYMFSGAKTYQQVREMSDLLASTQTYQEFRTEAMKVYETYNRDWLRAEYNTAYGQGTIANQWEKIESEKGIFPYLRYSAVMDANTSEICAGFNGITLPVNDGFWGTFSPLNHFNCRCILEQVDEFSNATLTTPLDKDAAMLNGKETVDEVFQMNPYYDGYVFSPEHPYFQVAPKDRGFAKDNFGLPIPPPLVEPPPEVIKPTPPPKPKPVTPKPKPEPKIKPKPDAKPVVKPKTEPKVEPKTKTVTVKPKQEFNYEFDKMKRAEIDASIKNMFAKNGNFRTIIDTSGVPEYQLRTYAKQLQNLMNEYKINPKSAYINGATKIKFRSSGRTYGYIQASKGVADPRSIGQVMEINFGNKTPIYNRVAGQTAEFSNVSAKNMDIGTLTHEFAHVMTTDIQSSWKFGDLNTQKFWKEIKEVEAQYWQESVAIRKAEGTKAMLKIDLGKYAGTNIDEFFAEGFTEYKLADKPSKYAEKIGNIVDKYFKK